MYKYGPLTRLTIRIHIQSHIVGVVLLAGIVLLAVLIHSQSRVVGVVPFTFIDCMLITSRSESELVIPSLTAVGSLGKSSGP